VRIGKAAQARKEYLQQEEVRLTEVQVLRAFPDYQNRD
jgi:hypothetical protein